MPQPLLSILQSGLQVKGTYWSRAQTNGRPIRQSVFCPDHSLWQALGGEDPGLQIGPDIRRNVTSIWLVKYACPDVRPCTEGFQKLRPRDFVTKFQRRR